MVERTHLRAADVVVCGAETELGSAGDHAITAGCSAMTLLRTRKPLELCRKRHIDYFCLFTVCHAYEIQSAAGRKGQKRIKGTKMKIRTNVL